MYKLLTVLSLILLSACSTYTFNLAQPHTEIWDIAPQTRECHGLISQQCIQVKRLRDSEWRNFYDPIEGFLYEPGFSYRIRLAVTPIENPVADGSNRHYTLLDILQKTPVQQPGTKQ